MVRKRQAEEIPQWVRDFITQRWEQEPEETEQQASHNTYLLCPFDQDEVKAVIAGVYKHRKEVHRAIAKEHLKSRKAGQLLPDSGFSENKEPISELLYFRNLLLTPLSRQQMQETVVKRYGRKKWTENPWGDSQKFYGWLGNIIDDDKPTIWEINEPLAIWAINETLAGRTFLAYGTVWILNQLDYSKMSEKDLLAYIGIGAENFLWVKSYTGWDNFERHYPAEPLPASLVNEQIIKGWPFWSLNAYRCFVASIYLWLFTLGEVTKRAKGNPELEGFLHHHTATDARIAELCQNRSPKGYRLPDKEQSWQKLEQALRKPLQTVAAKYNSGFPPPPEHEYVDTLPPSYVEAQGKLLDIVIDMKPRPHIDYSKLLFPLSEGDITKIMGKGAGINKFRDAVIKGLRGHLDSSLLSAVKHDFIDAAGKAYRKREVTESQIDETRQRDEEDTMPFLDTRPSQEPTPEELMLSKEPIDLKTLGFNKDELTPGELLLLKELEDASSKGYTKDSKEGLSLSQYWTDERVYQRKMKMLKRLEAKRNKP